MKKFLLSAVLGLCAMPALADAPPWANTSENPHWFNVLKPLMDMQGGMKFMKYPTRMEEYNASVAWTTHVWNTGRKFHQNYPDNPHWKEWMIFMAGRSPGFRQDVTEEFLAKYVTNWARTPFPKKYDSMEIRENEQAKAEFERIYAQLRAAFVTEATSEELASLRINELAGQAGRLIDVKGLVSKAQREGAGAEEAAASRRELEATRAQIKAGIIEVAAMKLDWAKIPAVERRLAQELVGGWVMKVPTFFSDYVQGSEEERSYWTTLLASTTSAAVRENAKGRLVVFDLMDNPLQLRFQALDGRQIDLEQLKGKPVLLQYWATNCVSCVAEVPALKALYEKYHAAGFEILGLSRDRDPKAVSSFVARNAVGWPQRVDLASVEAETARFGFTSISNFLLLGKDGRLLLFADMGMSHAELERLIRDELGLPHHRRG